MTDPERSRFDSYTPRRLNALGQGYSAFVRIMKFTLPVVALIIVGVLITRLFEESHVKPNISLLPKEEKTTPGQIELVGPKYEGVDEEGRPYTVTADRASRAMNAPDSVVFENAVADMLLQDKTWLAIKAKSGVFDRNTEVLKLTDDVHIFHDSGYELFLQDIEISLKEKTAFTTAPMTAQGPMGTIAAQNMTVKNQGDLIVFGGPATLTVFRLALPKGRG